MVLLGAAIEFKGQKYTADTRGEYKIDNIDIPSNEEKLSIKASAESFGFMPDEKKITLAPGHLFNVDFDLKDQLPGVEGIIIAGKVSMFLPTPIFDVMIKKTTANFEKKTKTNKNGEFSLKFLPPGTYLLEAKDSKGSTILTRKLNLKPNTLVSINFVQEEQTGALIGKVKDESGSPMPGISVILKYSGLLAPHLTTVTNNNGEYNFPNLTPGTYEIKFMIEGFFTKVRKGIVVKKGSKKTLDIIIEDRVFQMDIVEEISVQTGGLPAEWYSASGAVVNVVTEVDRSKLGGMVSAYYRDQELQADNTKGTVFEGEESGFDYEIEPVVNLGGPLIKNKVWFFVNASFKKSIEFVNGYPFNEENNAPYDRLQLSPYAKLTFKLDPDNKLVMSYNFSDDKRNHREASYQREVASTWKQRNQIHTIDLHYTRLFGDYFFMNFKAAVWNTLSPRIGVTYDITGDGRTVLKAHWGRYYIANILQWVDSVNPNSFITWRYRLNDDLTPKGDRYKFIAASGTEIDHDLKSPYLDEFNIRIERELFKDVKLGVRYIKKWDRKLIEDVDANTLDLDALMRGDDIFSVWTNYAPVTVTDPFDNSTQTFWNLVDPYVPWKGYITNPPGAERDYDGGEVTLEKRFSNNWSMNASYVYAKSRGLVGTDFDNSWTMDGYFDTPNAHINAYGNFPLERRHQFKLQVLVRGPWGINLGGFYRYLSGRRYQRQIRSLDFGLNLNQGSVTINAEKRGARKYPDLSILDLHLEKMFKMGKVRLSLFADIFNVFNINTAVDIYDLSSTSTTINGIPVVFVDAAAIYDPPRIFRIGSRIEF